MKEEIFYSFHFIMRHWCILREMYCIVAVCIEGVKGRGGMEHIPSSSLSHRWGEG